MKNKVLKGVLRYGVTTALALAVALPVAAYRGMGAAQPGYLNARYLSDGCFVAGLLFAGVGGLSWIATTGFFDMFRYALHSLLVLFTPLRKPEKHDSFYDYKTMRDEKRGEPHRFILVVGLVFVAASLVCLALYYRLPN